MRVRRLAGAAQFLETTLELRAADPVRTNVLGSVALSVVAGRRYERELWFVVQDGDDRVVGAALWTLPQKLLVTPMSADAARALGAAAAATGVPLHGAIAPVEVADALADGAGAAATPAMRERTLVLRDYRAPDPVPGAARLVAEPDVDRAVVWLDAFAAEAGVLAVDSRAAVLGSLGRLWFWAVDGEPVAMAGHAAVVATPGTVVGRVGPVWTPPELRGRRYGSAVTAAVVEHLLPRVDTVMLFTDAANPTSNAIYERLGFVHVADVVDLDFVPR